MDLGVEFPTGDRDHYWLFVQKNQTETLSKWPPIAMVHMCDGAYGHNNA